MRGLTSSVMVGISCLALAATGCGDRAEPKDPRVEDSTQEPPLAEAEAQPATPESATLPETIEVEIGARSGSELSGKATLEQRADGVLVRVDLASPTGTHAVHVHENGDCSAPDASSAGEHFNPDDGPHGLPPSEPRHLGDLGNIEVSAEGGTLEILVPRATLAGTDRMSFLNRAIIVHQNLDSGAQPSGDAGDRIGCGEIRASS